MKNLAMTATGLVAVYCLGYLSGVGISSPGPVDHGIGAVAKPSRRGSRKDTAWLDMMDTNPTAKKICLSKLNELDQTYDSRRSIRKAIVAKADKQAKNVYELLWKPASRPTTPERKIRDQALEKVVLFDLWEPEAVCFTEERFGGDSDERYNAFGDGPKFVCGVDLIRSKPSCLVYSIGSNNNILFEKAIKNQIDCETHTFDPTLSAPFKGGEYASFHPWGLGVDGEKVSFIKKGSLVNRTLSFETMSLQHIMKKLHHKKRKIDIFKIDCERCEYSAMPPVFDAIARGDLEIDQIQIELHSESFETITAFFEMADKARMRVFHKERNGWGCRGTRCIEYAFISESFLREANAQVVCPSELFLPGYEETTEQKA
jgi:hypothetical protein